MSNTAIPQKQTLIFQQQINPPKLQKLPQLHGDVRQDIHAQPRMDVASVKPPLSAPPENGQSSQSANKPHGSDKRKTVQVWGCVNRTAAAEVERLRSQWGSGEKKLSQSAVVAKLVEQGVQEHVDMQYGALLEPVMKAIIREEMQPLISLLRWLLIRVAFDTNQTRSLVANILSNDPNITKDMLENILIQTAKAAKGNIFGKTPQLNELVQEFDLRLAGMQGKPRTVQ